MYKALIVDFGAALLRPTMVLITSFKISES